MSIFIAPGVYSVITDLSQYAAPVSATACGVIGAARKGPILGKFNPYRNSYNQPILITTPQEFIATFGTPSVEFQGPYAALLYLQQGRQLYYGRVASAGGVVTTSGNLVIGEIYKAVGTTGYITCNSVQVNVSPTGTYFVAGASTYTVSVYGDGVVQTSEALSASKGWNGGKLTVTALSEGLWGNKLSFSIQDSLVAGAKKLTVYQLIGSDQVVQEQFDGLLSDPTSPQFYDKQINNVSQFIMVTYDTTQTGQPINTAGVAVTNGNLVIGETYIVGGTGGIVNATITYATGTTFEAGATTFTTATGSPTVSTYGPIFLTGGYDGQVPTDGEIIGAQLDSTSTGIQAFADVDQVDIALLAAPGYTSPAVLAAIETLVESRQDCLATLHAPMGFNVQQAIDWHNAKPSSPYAPDAEGPGTTPSVQITSNCCAMYWPWIEIFDPYNNVNVWVPPVGFALQTMAYTDNVSEPWFAPAGINRGKCFQALRTEFSVTLGQRATMYGPGNGNALNPIVTLPLDGITIYGQRTMQRTASSLDRINVRRMMFYISKVLQISIRGLVFEQNDAQLWDQFKLIVGPFMQDIMARRGVEDVKVLCDINTNTAVRRNNNEMYGYVLLVPTKTAEKIIMNFQLFPSGVSLSAPQIG